MYADVLHGERQCWCKELPRTPQLLWPSMPVSNCGPKAQKNNRDNARYEREGRAKGDTTGAASVQQLLLKRGYGTIHFRAPYLFLRKKGNLLPPLQTYHLSRVLNGLPARDQLSCTLTADPVSATKCGSHCLQMAARDCARCLNSRLNGKISLHDFPRDPKSPGARASAS